MFSEFHLKSFIFVFVAFVVVTSELSAILKTENKTKRMRRVNEIVPVNRDKNELCVYME